MNNQTVLKYWFLMIIITSNNDFKIVVGILHSNIVYNTFVVRSEAAEEKKKAFFIRFVLVEQNHSTTRNI